VTLSVCTCLFAPAAPPQDVETLSSSALQSVLGLATVYYWLPKSRGEVIMSSTCWEVVISSLYIFKKKKKEDEEEGEGVDDDDDDWLFLSGVSLRRKVREATVEVLEAVAQLVEVILSAPLQRYTHTHTSTHT